MRRIAGSQQILTTALRPHASCVRNILLREKPLASSSIVTSQPHCSDFVEAKLKRLAHSYRKHCIDYSDCCLDVLILCSVFRRCKDLATIFPECENYGIGHRFGCSKPQQNRGQVKTLERQNDQFCMLDCRDLIHRKNFLAGREIRSDDSNFTAVQLVAAALRRTERRPLLRRLSYRQCHASAAEWA